MSEIGELEVWAFCLICLMNGKILEEKETSLGKWEFSLKMQIGIMELWMKSLQTEMEWSEMYPSRMVWRNSMAFREKLKLKL